MENKVLNFLEWYQNAIHNINTEFKDIGLGLCIIRDFLNSLHNSANFYSQSFKPEMITELFCEGRDIATNTPFSVKDILMQKPETLDEFIMYAKKYFTLTWKPEILNKYFK